MTRIEGQVVVASDHTTSGKIHSGEPLEIKLHRAVVVGGEAMG